MTLIDQTIPEFACIAGNILIFPASDFYILKYVSPTPTPPLCMRSRDFRLKAQSTGIQVGKS